MMPFAMTRRDVGPIDVPFYEHFRLGMPHLDHDGVRRGWLLREACHIHWTAIALEIGMPASEFRDRSGARVLASVVACTVNGDASQFREDDTCQIYLTESPRAETGWRSQVDLTNSVGAWLRAEIVTSFARRNGPSNRDLAAADLAPRHRADRDGRAARRTNVIRRLGAVDRARAKADKEPAHQSIPVRRSVHINGVGLVGFAVIHDLIAHVEAIAVPKLLQAWPMRNRRMHFFGNLDPGDTMDITTRASAEAIAPSAAVLVRSHTKRASDDAVIVTAESVYGH